MDELETANKQNLKELAYERLKQNIVNGKFVPGRKLTIRAIAELLETSVTPARDAIMRLITEGALTNAGPKTVIVPELNWQMINEITQMRVLLEGLAAVEATHNIKTEDILGLESIQERLVHALRRDNYSDVLELNKVFHFTLYEKSNMPRLVIIIESLWLQIAPSFTRLYPNYSINRRSISNHSWMIRGLHDRDHLTVRAAVENDLRDGLRRLKAIHKPDLTM